MIEKRLRCFVRRHERLKRLLVFLIQSFGPNSNLRRFLFFLLKGHVFARLIYWKMYKLDGIDKLQIGGGYRTKKGWINVDIIAGDFYYNVVKSNFIHRESLSVIFAEQFVEHIDFDSAKRFFRNSYIQLKKGGVLRIATPDLEKLVLLYNDAHPDISKETPVLRHFEGQKGHTYAEFFNGMFRDWGHSFIWDFETLKKELLATGFKKVTRVSFGKSNHKLLQNLERHADCEWMKDGFNLVVEAEK